MGRSAQPGSAAQPGRVVAAQLVLHESRARRTGPRRRGQVCRFPSRSRQQPGARRERTGAHHGVRGLGRGGSASSRHHLPGRPRTRRLVHECYHRRRVLPGHYQSRRRRGAGSRSGWRRAHRTRRPSRHRAFERWRQDMVGSTHGYRRPGRRSQPGVRRAEERHRAAVVCRPRRLRRLRTAPATPTAPSGCSTASMS